MKKILKFLFNKVMLSSIPHSMKSKINDLASIYLKKKLDSNKEFDLAEGNQTIQIKNSMSLLERYAKQVLELPEIISSDYCDLTGNPIVIAKEDPKLVAYYLTQFHPTEENDKWWGLGTTEWNNVSRAVPQFVGHYQPRLPGELGYYDLRIKENMIRQALLAKTYGISAFCFYYYWFDGRRLLEEPLDMFLNNKDIDIEFSLCWANENWTRRFDGTSSEILMNVGSTIESYKEFIHDIQKYLEDPRYMTIDGKKVIQIYRPSKIPKPGEVVSYWREISKLKYDKELYLVGVDEGNYYFDFHKYGFDAMTEFQPGSSVNKRKEIDVTDLLIRKDFEGVIYDYKEITKSASKKYNKMYKAVMPMWDNTPRRNNKGIIFQGATPKNYQEWLEKVINDTNNNNELDDKLVFINAWNEWGEGAYLEPDRKYGYAFLNATKNAIENTRNLHVHGED